MIHVCFVFLEKTDGYICLTRYLVLALSLEVLSQEAGEL